MISGAGFECVTKLVGNARWGHIIPLTLYTWSKHKCHTCNNQTSTDSFISIWDFAVLQLVILTFHDLWDSQDKPKNWTKYETVPVYCARFLEEGTVVNHMIASHGRKRRYSVVCYWWWRFLLLNFGAPDSLDMFDLSICDFKQ